MALKTYRRLFAEYDSTREVSEVHGTAEPEIVPNVHKDSSTESSGYTRSLLNN